MKIAEGVHMLEIEMDMMGRKSVIHPTLFVDGGKGILVDTGMPNQLDALQAAVEKAGVTLADIEAVVLTHQDIDHIGGIRDVIAAVGHPIDVYAHGEDKPYIEGDKEPIKMNRARVEQMLANLPEEMRPKAQAMFADLPKAQITKVLADGGVIPFAGGIQVIFTPGHTPGHISLYHRASKTIVAGDSTVSNEGKLLGPSEGATPDMALALQSLAKYTQYDIENAICYHGGLCNENVNDQFRELTK